MKTRLAQAVGSETALDTYQTLVEVITAKLAGVKPTELHFAPADAETEILPWLNDDWTTGAQCEGDLGQKLVHAFEQAFDRDSDRVVIIGSDCPYVNETDIQDAFAALDKHDVAIGPATDGGYWLIGLGKPQPELFAEINWSTETVLAETESTAEAMGLSLHRLRELSDVDNVADLMRFHEWSLSQAASETSG